MHNYKALVLFETELIAEWNLILKTHGLYNTFNNSSLIKFESLELM